MALGVSAHAVPPLSGLPRHMKRQLRVEVIDASRPIDLEKWVEDVLRIILPMNGIAVRPAGTPEPEPMRKAS
jgi:hypothetical protein